MAIPTILIMNPALIMSIILTLPVENIIALGGVARNKKNLVLNSHMKNKTYQ